MSYSHSKVLLRGLSAVASNQAIKDLKYNLAKIPGGPKEINKSVTVAIIGKANVGKSTLINAMMGMKICASSMKPQTTMRYQRVFHVQGDTEIVLLDTPGIVSAKNKKKYGIKDKADAFTIKTLKDVDLVGVVVDASDKYTKSILPSDVKRLMTTFPNKTEMILILNKVDRVKDKFSLLKYADKVCNDVQASDDINLSNRWFSRIFMISALINDGVDAVVEYIRSVALEKNYQSSGRLSDHPDHRIVEERVRAGLLEYFKYNVPYACSSEVEYMEENALGKVNILVLVRCPTATIHKIVSNDSVLNKISVECEEDFRKIFGKPVFVRLIPVGPEKDG